MKKLEIRKDDLIYNLNLIREIIDEKTKVIAVVKANGMGLGLVEYAKLLEKNNVEYIAVANVEEAIALKEAGIEAEILMLTPVCLKNELQLLIDNDITIAVGSLEEFELAENICAQRKKEIKAHLKIDTGFGRYGFLYTENEKILEVFRKCENVKIEGMFTHFSKPIDEKYTEKQFERFEECSSFIRENGFEINMLHACATTATLKYPHMHLDAVRIGSGIQGRVLVKKDQFKKVGTFKTTIQEIKEVPKGYNISYNNTYRTKKNAKIAIISVGYIDGLNKNKLRDDFSFKNNLISVIMEIMKLFKDNSLKAEINGRKYKIIGKLGMYHAIIDITGTNNINVGDEVILDITPIQTNDGIRREYI